VIGEIVGNFVIIQQLGRGGMGEVWLAEQREIKTRVAIKMLLRHISDDRQHVQRFFNEAVAVSRIKHSGIAKIFDVGYHKNQAYLVMEFLEGEPLAARLRRIGRFPLPQLGDVGRQIAGVLEATHAEGITHRDLKPDNIFLVRDSEMTSGERVKILDFGIAKLSDTTGITGTGQGSMGTPAYMSPEQWRHSAKVDHRADIYSLGCVVFELATGTPPFVASSIGEACNMHLNEPPPSLASRVGGMPPALDALLARMLAKDPQARPSIAEIRAGFTNLDAPYSGPTLQLPETAPPMIRPVTGEDGTTLGNSAGVVAASPRRSRAPIGIAIAVVAAGGIATAIALTREPDGAASATRPGEPVQTGSRPATDTPPHDRNLPDAPALPPGWIAITPPVAAFELGVPADAPATTLGFRPGRGVTTPSTPYAIQAHEVTWGEIAGWLAEHREHVPPELPAWARDEKAREQLPASGLTWSAASAYCKSIGGRLPSEEEWEFAARGVQRRANPWGADAIDSVVNRVYRGADATPAAVKTLEQDRTPDGIHDLAGNVQEWTSSLWREDRPGQDETWVQDVKTGTSFRAIRGLPLSADPPKRGEMPTHAATYRMQFCATGVCVEKSRKRLPYIGFRCARNL
jgi:eukaryotic-like serine/threonine-protein kinase